MIGHSRRLSGSIVIVACCVLAGCGAYGPSFVQGSKSDTPLEVGVGQEFQKLVPPGTTVKDVRCSRPPTRMLASECKIVMTKDKPDRGYTYLVSTGRHHFLAERSNVTQADTWIPPLSFSGGY